MPHYYINNNRLSFKTQPYSGHGLPKFLQHVQIKLFRIKMNIVIASNNFLKIHGHYILGQTPSFHHFYQPPSLCSHVFYKRNSKSK